jgi:hypothetical protein
MAVSASAARGSAAAAWRSTRSASIAGAPAGSAALGATAIGRKRPVWLLAWGRGRKRPLRLRRAVLGLVTRRVGRDWPVRRGARAPRILWPIAARPWESASRASPVLGAVALRTLPRSARRPVRRPRFRPRFPRSIGWLRRVWRRRRRPGSAGRRLLSRPARAILEARAFLVARQLEARARIAVVTPRPPIRAALLGLGLRAHAEPCGLG